MPLVDTGGSAVSAKTRHMEETTVETGHRLRAMTILLVLAILTIGIWYLVSDRD
jgi:hypothetical protein